MTAPAGSRSRHRHRTFARPGDLTESFLGRLDGTAFDAPSRIANESVTRIAEWARPVTDDHAPLVVRLDPPDQGNAWKLEVFAPGAKGSLVPIERAIVDARAKARDLEEHMLRLERLLPVLRRPGVRRGQVILSQDEAWDLMANTGAWLVSAGFDVRVPELAAHRCDADAASLRRHAVDLGGGRGPTR